MLNESSSEDENCDVADNTLDLNNASIDDDPLTPTQKIHTLSDQLFGDIADIVNMDSSKESKDKVSPKNQIQQSDFYGTTKKDFVKHNLNNTSNISLPKSITKTNTIIYERYSGLSIKNPLVSNEEMKRRMEDHNRIMISLSAIKTQICQIRDDDTDWVTIGVVITKLPPQISQKGKLFSIWKLSDLKSQNVVTFFLFGKVHEAHWQIPVGSVIGLLNASIMPEKKGKQKQFVKEICSITLDNPGKLMLLGQSNDFALCSAEKESGEKCNAIINARAGNFCMKHMRSAFQKFGVKRPEFQSFVVNSVVEKAKKCGSRMPKDLSDDIQKSEPPLLFDRIVNKEKFQQVKQEEEKMLSKHKEAQLTFAARNLAAANTSDNTKVTKKFANRTLSARTFLGLPEAKAQKRNPICNEVPILGKGFSPGDIIDFSNPPSTKKVTKKNHKVSLLLNIGKPQTVLSFPSVTKNKEPTLE